VGEERRREGEGEREREGDGLLFPCGRAST
jgi:hypothetical protein